MGLSLEDLVSEGNIGLLQAAQHFDPTRGTRFITCAVWWIRKAILKALSRHSAMIRLPPRQRDRIKRMGDAARSLSSRLGREPDRDEISREMGLSVTKIDAIIQMRLQEVSLEDRVGSIEPGKKADLALLDRNPIDLSSTPEQIGGLAVRMTVSGGTVVFEDRRMAEARERPRGVTRPGAGS